MNLRPARWEVLSGVQVPQWQTCRQAGVVVPRKGTAEVQKRSSPTSVLLKAGLDF